MGHPVPRPCQFPVRRVRQSEEARLARKTPVETPAESFKTLEEVQYTEGRRPRGLLPPLLGPARPLALRGPAAELPAELAAVGP